MYAVIATGGKQYRVEKGGVLRIEKLEAELGATVEFNEVLLIADGDNMTWASRCWPAARCWPRLRSTPRATRSRS
jgi:ribosomal protein L21